MHECEGDRVIMGTCADCGAAVALINGMFVDVQSGGLYCVSGDETTMHVARGYGIHLSNLGAWGGVDGLLDRLGDDRVSVEHTDVCESNVVDLWVCCCDPYVTVGE